MYNHTFRIVLEMRSSFFVVNITFICPPYPLPSNRFFCRVIYSMSISPFEYYSKIGFQKPKKCWLISNKKKLIPDLHQFGTSQQHTRYSWPLQPYPPQSDTCQAHTICSRPPWPDLSIFHETSAFEFIDFRSSFIHHQGINHLLIKSAFGGCKFNSCDIEENTEILEQKMEEIPLPVE